MWLICKLCGALVADEALHRITHSKKRRKKVRYGY